MSEDSGTRFGAKTIAIFGMVSGLVIAVVLPHIVLTDGAELSTAVKTTIIIIAVLVGGLISLTATFFGLVLPNRTGR